MTISGSKTTNMGLYILLSFIKKVHESPQARFQNEKRPPSENKTAFPDKHPTIIHNSTLWSVECVNYSKI